MYFARIWLPTGLVQSEAPLTAAEALSLMDVPEEDGMVEVVDIEGRPVSEIALREDVRERDLAEAAN